ncbi:MAG TPA: tetratricopeptide repeat protein [Polyangiaceae bacterium]
MPAPDDRDPPTTSDTATAEPFGDRRPPLRRGACVGRYVVLDRAGEGGMGVVYKAYDPELERTVALKLLHAGTRAGDEAERRRARLLREAKALARLSHPNVIAVHDVGTFQDDVFLATEFVDGAPLKSWLRERKRSGADVLRVMLEAGAGLAAAHHAGLVHRDFKPGNLMIGRDGRARVLDFGLARTDHSEDPTLEAAAVRSPDPAPGRLDEPLTGVDQVVGTPHYMAPEQRTGRPVDARGDQYSFCVTFADALEGVEVPRRVRQLLGRGLAEEPGDRWPSMDALLAELRRDPAAARRRALATAGVGLALAAAVAAGSLATSRKAAPPCRGAEQKLAGVWDPARKQAVSAAFAASGAPGAGETFGRVETALDEYASGWTAMRTDACEATRVRAEQSAELMDLRMECLDQRLGELRAQVDVLARADAPAVDRAVQAARSLRPLDACADTAGLRAPIRPAADAATRARVDAVRARLAEGQARQRVGGYAEALAIATEAAGEASALGYRPLEAEALFLLGDVQDDAGDYKASERTMIRAASAAVAGHHDTMLARSLAALVVEVGLRQARFDEAHGWASLAEAAAERGEPFVRGEVHRNLGRLLYREGKFAEARAQTEACLAVWEPALGAEAMAVAGPLTDLGNAFYAEGDYARAADTYQRSIAVLEKSVGPDSALLGPNLNNLGDVASRVGDFDRAQAALERALAVWTRGLGPEHPKVALAIYNLGEVARRRGDPERALLQYRRALAIDERTLGPASPETAYAVEGIADALRARGDVKGALAAYGRALAVREKALGPSHVEVADTLTGMGLAELARRRPRRAVALLERALAIRASQPGDPADLAETRAALERARAAASGP